jgi:hypothetical protein
MESEPRKIVAFYSGNWAQNAQEIIWSSYRQFQSRFWKISGALRDNSSHACGKYLEPL